MRSNEFLIQTRDFLMQSYDEYKKYIQFHNINYLRQASGKLFTVAENLVEYKTNVYVDSFSKFRNLITKTNIKYKDLLVSQVFQLNVFYYHGEAEGLTQNDISHLYLKVYHELKSGLNQL